VSEVKEDIWVEPPAKNHTPCSERISRSTHGLNGTGWQTLENWLRCPQKQSCVVHEIIFYNIFLCQQALSIRNTYAWQLHLYKTSRKNRNYCFNSVVHVEQSANVDTANVRSLWKSIGFDSNFLLYKILWRLWLLMGNLCTHRFAHQHVTETWNFLNNYNVNS